MSGFRKELADLLADVRRRADWGVVPSSIPALAGADPERLGLVLVTAGGECFGVGDAVERVDALMVTSGVYDSAGDSAHRVGLAGKSGVDGSSAAVLPKKWAVTSPGLDAHGNSKTGMRLLELLTSRTGASLL